MWLRGERVCVCMLRVCERRERVKAEVFEMAIGKVRGRRVYREVQESRKR